MIESTPLAGLGATALTPEQKAKLIYNEARSELSGRLWRAGAEDRPQTTEEACFGCSGMMVGRGLQLADLCFQCLDPLRRRRQSLLLQDHRLGEKIRRIGLRPDGISHHGLGRGVAWCRGGGLDAVEQAGQQLAFVR